MRLQRPNLVPDRDGANCSAESIASNFSIIEGKLKSERILPGNVEGVKKSTFLTFTYFECLSWFIWK